MDDRFDQEFYRSVWQRVLPVGPDGIQPYVRTASGPGWQTRSSGQPRAAAMLAGWARGVIAFGRRAASGMAKRPLRLEIAPREQRRQPALRLQETPRSARRAAATRRLSEAA